MGRRWLRRAAATEYLAVRFVRQSCLVSTKRSWCCSLCCSFSYWPAFIARREQREGGGEAADKDEDEADNLERTLVSGVGRHLEWHAGDDQRSDPERHHPRACERDAQQQVPEQMADDPEDEVEQYRPLG